VYFPPGRIFRAFLKALLKGNPEPQVGKWLESNGWKSSKGRTGSENESIFLNGAGQKLLYTMDSWPESDFSLSLWFQVEQLPTNHLGQIFSAWCAPSDDPLRLVIDGGRLFARIEAGNAYSTSGVPVTPGQWRHAAVVKFGSKLSLYMNGEQKSAIEVPEYLTTNARDFALGGNPHFTGNEHLGVHLSELRFYPRALSPEEVRALTR
jgi:hypothetical protein